RRKQTDCRSDALRDHDRQRQSVPADLQPERNEQNRGTVRREQNGDQSQTGPVPDDDLRLRQVKPASIAQVRRSKDGHMVSLEGDLLEVIAQVKDISPDLSVRYSPTGEYFAVFERT